jgi:hypothetical protein
MTAISTKSRSYINSLALGVVGAAALILTGCGGAATSVIPGVTASHSAFGQPVAWSDGMTMLMSTPQAFTPSESAASSGADPAQKPARYVLNSVTITNGSEADVALNGGFSFTATSNGTALVQVMDPVRGVDLPPMVTLLPGKSITFKTVFALPTTNPADFQVDAIASYGPGFQTATFTGTT